MQYNAMVLGQEQMQSNNGLDKSVIFQMWWFWSMQYFDTQGQGFDLKT